MRIGLTFLGTGTSQGVPVIGCGCGVCTSTDLRDARLRTSAMLELGEQCYVIDSGPDFRQQMLREGVQRLDGIVYTHEHKDHVAGMDDVRAFNYIQGRDVRLFATERVEAALRREFHYAFDGDPYPGVPRVSLHRIDERPFRLGGATWWPLPLRHLSLPVLGFRVGGVGYVTDANYLEEEAWERLDGVDTLVINALRRAPHPSHFTLEEALEVVERVQPRQAYLIHLSHQMGRHAELSAELPAGVACAYDGLQVTVEGADRRPERSETVRDWDAAPDAP